VPVAGPRFEKLGWRGGGGDLEEEEDLSNRLNISQG